MAWLATELYWACTHFMVNAANLFGVTYRDANALLFFVIWPLVTLTLIVVVVRQRRRLRELKRHLEAQKLRAQIAAKVVESVRAAGGP